MINMISMLTTKLFDEKEHYIVLILLLSLFWLWCCGFDDFWLWLGRWYKVLWKFFNLRSWNGEIIWMIHGENCWFKSLHFSHLISFPLHFPSTLTVFFVIDKLSCWSKHAFILITCHFTRLSFFLGNFCFVWYGN